MSSSPTVLSATVSTAPQERLLVHLSRVPDPRDPRGVRYPLSGLLGVAVSAVLGGARSFTAIGEWAAALTVESLACLGLETAPTESNLRKLFARVDTAALDLQLAVFAWTRTCDIAGRRVIAIDGKTIRGARTTTTTAPHLVAALDHAAGVVLGQIAVADKSNEIPAVRDLLAGFDAAEVHGCVITVDAMHTQTDTASAILDAGADYVFTVKGNQPGLHKRLKALPWRDVPAHTSTDTTRGRRITRTIKVADAPPWTGFTGAAQIAQIRRTRTIKGKKTIEIVYLITSATGQAAPPTMLATWAQGHWGIENRLHWVRDVTFDEDRSQVRTGNTPHVMASLRNIAIGLLRLTGWTNIAAGLRHHARNPQDTIKCLLTC